MKLNPQYQLDRGRVGALILDRLAVQSGRLGDWPRDCAPAHRLLPL